MLRADREADAETLSRRELAEKVKGGHRKAPSGGRADGLARGSAAATAARVARSCAFPLSNVELEHAATARLTLEEVREAFWAMSGPAFADWLERRIVTLGGQPRIKAAE